MRLPGFILAFTSDFPITLKSLLEIANAEMKTAGQEMNNVAAAIISLLQEYIRQLGFTPVIHFELEGCYVPGARQALLDYAQVNRQLRAFGIEGKLIPEYWQNQWEYVSDFSGQPPLKEAANLAFVMANMARIMASQGVAEVLIKPVVWAGDRGKLAQGSKTIFAGQNRDVHIPNAIQMNVSALDASGENLIPNAHFGEYLQQRFLQTSLACCLLYLPEEEAFARLQLKTSYGLENELCSPVDISGGHQGSVALYKEHGKHNQKMGEEAVLYGQDNRVLVSEHNWHRTARVEHRLGASSLRYNPFINIIFALLNLIDALEVFVRGNCRGCLQDVRPQPLPPSLYDRDGQPGAVTLFERDHWFAESIGRVVTELNENRKITASGIDEACGHQLKEQVLSCYQPRILTAP